MATAAMPQREIIRFEAGRPETIRLKYATGREISGQYGPQVMFTTVDNRIFFVDPEVAGQIADAGIGEGEPFRLIKCRRPKGGWAWEIERMAGGVWKPAAEVQPEPPAPEPPYPPAADASVRAEAPPVVTTAQAKLLAALCVAIDSACEAQAYAARKGMPLNFTGEDIRCFANTILINAERGARP
ncbi:MAG: hypothetical protein JO345_12030 [Streptosporangiaceae bacterium]|nr:hypothetical protein [Streptosporangiaceae bacterium]